ncbi:hypothetical protein BDD12DRAFT_803348 [Trichophaea hybrida]|nr:hypothetical protein BDD12DRAFT_803348 [Trichophaea hybrida]
MTRSKGTKHSKNSSGSSGQSDLKSSGRKGSNHDAFQRDTRRRNDPHSNGRVQQRLEGGDYGNDCDDGWQWRMAPESGDLREYQVSTSFDDDNNDDHNGGDADGDLTTSTCESRNRRESYQLFNATPPSNQEHARQLPKLDRSPVDIGCRLKRKIGDIGVSKVWWDVACDIFFCRILTKDPYPTDVDNLSAESFERACSYLKEALYGDMSTVAIHTSAAQEIFAKQACEIAPVQYIDNFRNMSNDDWQKHVARLISPCTYRFHHSDCENEHSLDNLEAGGFLRVPFEADIYKVSNKLPQTYTNLYTQWESIPELNQKRILQIHMNRIDRANGINRKGLAVTRWDPNTVIVDEDADE